jgi:ribosomal-protein-serine acetyltransferase
MFGASLRPGVELRLLEERHAPTLFTVIEENRDHLSGLPFVDATHVEDDSLSFVRHSLEQFARNEGFAAGIWKDGGLIGVIGTLKIDWLNRKVEIGYWIARAFQGQGIMTDACRAVINHAFAEWDLHRVEIQCASTNLKSSAVARRLGFALEGTRREAHLVSGAYHDLQVFGMLKQHWKL